MAKLCIRITPNPNATDPSLDALRTQEGDVVCIVGDGHVFSHAELTCGQYRILDLPGVPEVELIHLVESRTDANGTMIARRTQALDLAVLKNPLWRDRISATKAEVVALTRMKP